MDYVPSSTLEDAIDCFVQDVLKHVGNACDGLDAEHRQLQSERTDPTAATWRKLEAMLGFDPDDAPSDLVDGFEALTERYGAEPLEEAALAHQGERASEALEHCIEAAESSFSLQAVNAAAQLRDRIGVPPGPIRNTRLGETVDTNVGHPG